MRRIAELLKLKFSFPVAGSPQHRSDFPELQIMALLVIAVKLYYPFDTIERHPKALGELGVLAIDWNSWMESQKRYDERATAGGKIGRGNEIKVSEEDVWKMSEDQMDEYLDWFEKTWVDEDRARTISRALPDQLLDMFPTGRLDGSAPATVSYEQEVRDDAAALMEKIQANQASLKLRDVISDDEASTNDIQVNRIGSYYKRFRKEEDFPEHARAFYKAAANAMAVTSHTLVVAVLQIERKLQIHREKELKHVTSDEEDIADTD